MLASVTRGRQQQQMLHEDALFGHEWKSNHSLCWEAPMLPQAIERHNPLNELSARHWKRAGIPKSCTSPFLILVGQGLCKAFRHESCQGACQAEPHFAL